VPRLTLVIPCYRDAHTLGRALDSVAKQTRPPDETIVVDDASPHADMIRDLVRGRPGVRCVRNEENSGLAASRNRGIAEASGDIVTFLDADDEAHPQRFEWQVRYVDAGTAVACDLQHITPGTAPDLGAFTGAKVDVVRGVGKLIYANRLCGASLMAHAGLLRSVGGYDTSLRSSEDFDLWLRLLAGGVTVRRIRLPLYLYHDNPEGLSRRYRNIAESELQVVRKFVSAGHAGDPESLHAATILGVWLLRHFLRAKALSDPALRQQAQQNLSQLLAPRRPILAALVRAAGSTALHRLVFPPHVRRAFSARAGERRP
jgi:glycosyltransferase involved in cell wall biosynthesis